MVSTWHRHGGNFQRTVIMENANQWEEYFPSVSMHNRYKTETAVLFLKLTVTVRLTMHLV